MFTRILQFKLRVIAKLTLQRYRPTIIAVTGSVGKTSTKDAIACVLASRASVRASGGNLNNELGVPLTILGDWSHEYYTRGGTLWFWTKVLMLGTLRLVYCRYPAYLVLEYGADRPGDIAALARTYPPRIGVVTAVGDIPVHVEFYASPEAVAREKAELIKALPQDGFAVLNADDMTVYDMRASTRAKVLTFGFADHAGFRLSNLETMVNAIGKPEGISCKLHDARSFVPLKVPGSLGSAQAMAATAAAAVADALGIHLVTVSEALAGYHGPAGRLRILPGIRGSTIIDDSYNASPAAVRVALEALRTVPVTAEARRIAVLGDMAELGRYTLQAHGEIGNRAAEVADVLVCIGQKARFIADAAANQMLEENIHWYESSDAARQPVQQLVREHDVVLVKGSQSVRTERIVREIMANPERAPELLVRQSTTWLVK